MGLIRVKEYLNTEGYLSLIAAQVYPFILIKYLPRDGYFQQDNDPCFRLELSPNGLKSMTETLPCSVGLHNHPISSYSRVNGIRSDGAGNITIQCEGIGKCNLPAVDSNSSHTTSQQPIQIMSRGIHAVLTSNDGPILY
ncbi:hypothetical protein TNCV_4600441 [Trichonephila clavipes]|nr:hypothetical protein TNCV_4600441 [Trichonephila clavipes]